MQAPRWAYLPLLIAFLTVLAGVVLCFQGSVGWGILTIGVGLLAFAVLTFIIQGQFLKRAYQTDGIVIGHKMKNSDGETWFPMVRYRLPNGQEITFQGNTPSSRMRKSLPVSTKVSVLYDPQRPENAMINKRLEKSGPYALGLFASAFLIFGILILAGLLPG